MPMHSWTRDELSSDRAESTQRFRDERIDEPLDHYLDFYSEAYAVFSDILEVSADLTMANSNAQEMLATRARIDLCRYIASPPLSADDLKTLADTSLAPTVIAKDPSVALNIIEIIFLGLDRERFPWVGEGRDATEAERHTALVATSAMFAFRKVETWRRSRGASLEAEVKAKLVEAGFREVPPVKIKNSSQGPKAGEFSGEASVAGGKADIVVRLHDGRLMPIECKVSNSEVNSYKRLIHDCGEKAQAWVNELGPANCVPVAALQGVFSLKNLVKAQNMGLKLVWEHNLDALAEFIESAR
ncbi:XamI restriction endonuclease [Nocardioides exalbidus]|uniref:XamI restriction endonuclease n=1 Tax=Nocardioides exalbidus TaxID=402596 RepID=A0A1H4S3K4_9ACTN|nr:XamI family restriction endonuclease [Nocardioides exalbidus]SEC38624.1 XamI restriction endonuclease [Nocardioides exalbidus]